MMRDTPQLERAIRIWRRGNQISVTLWAALERQGYDVAALERHNSI